ncbi:MAG: DUF5985 family protein [Burkholderiales bacterium]
MAELVYFLCAATSLACAVLLLRGYAQSKARLLLWSGLCFVFLALNNVLLVFDLVLFPAYDLSLWRSWSAVIGVGLLIYGLIWEVD